MKCIVRLEVEGYPPIEYTMREHSRTVAENGRDAHVVLVPVNDRISLVVSMLTHVDHLTPVSH